MSNSKKCSKNRKKKVIVVDDHPIVRQGLAQLINQEEIIEVCCEAADIPSAVETINSCTPDIAIIDISLGKSSGIRLIEDLSNRHPEMPILALSMHDESVYAERCLRAGARGYIMKKEPPEKVITAIKRILNNEVYVSDNLGSKLLHKFISKEPGIYSSPVDRLSNRELEVFEFIGQGLKTREIADRLNLSIKTIETYIDHIKKKMNFKDSRNLFLNAVQWLMGDNPK